MFKIQKAFKNANIASTVRFTEEIYEQLKGLSDSTGVSFNTIVLQCCQYALENLERDAN